MDRILIILKKENGPRASSAPALGLNTIIFKTRGRRFDPGLLQSVGWDYKPRPHLHMTLAVGLMLNPNQPTIIFKHVYWYMQQTQVSVYRTIGPLVFYIIDLFRLGDRRPHLGH